MAHAAPSSGSSSSGRHAQPDPDQSGLPTGPSGVPQRVHLPERGTAENTVGWLTAVIGALSIGVVIAIIVVLIIGVVQRG
ncbi:MAG TPA: hypothetical protein VFS29_08375 [Motilibacteraceae bacterium]|nr:hypothetical protein [Motilibacteraceae bacterium]